MRDRKPGWRVFKYILLGVLAIALLPSMVGMGRAVIACRMWQDPETNDLGSGTPDPAVREVTDEIPGYVRLEDQTYLTFPEWYIVYSADEYADFISENPPSRFPHFKAIGQYWRSYYDICGVTRGRYPLNGSYHFTLGFIGFSFTAENTFKGLYETTVGRAAEWFGPDEPTKEELYARQVAEEYGAFLHHTPWYDFPFGEKLSHLWNETDLWGPGPVRKWERKLALSMEYGSKALFGGFISKASRVTYGGPDESKIHAVAEGVTEQMSGPDLEIIDEIDEDTQVLYMTRYEVFSQVVPPLMQEGLKFVEIAGNDEILVSVFGPQAGDYDLQYGEYLFELPVLSRPGTARAAIKVRVAELHLLLEELQGREDLQFEHIYDY